ncbi:hypothetical protein X943_001604 [Babesia divergens]|uniref:PRELI/MSF1 domain-containing protein n=1 Tax=Babesia divergens TaxID=32595 RepID=A0AAD9LHY9_BABDI|nr:hypothetical protein X943_001604 [Babesia divergens]
MLFTKSFVCNFDWEIVARAFYRMYPSKHYPHVRDIHIIDHEVIPESKQLKVRRIARVTYNFPSIVHYIVGPSIEYMMLEESLLDLNTRSISVKTTGFTMLDSYRYDEEASLMMAGSGKTQYNSAIEFRILGFGFFNSTLESVARRVVTEFSEKDSITKAIVEAVNNLD